MLPKYDYILTNYNNSYLYYLFINTYNYKATKAENKSDHTTRIYGLTYIKLSLQIRSSQLLVKPI